MSDLPALTPEAIAQHIAGWPKNCRHYIMARLRDPERPKADICRDVIGLDPQAVYRWRHGGLYGPGVAGFQELDDAISNGLPMLQLEMAQSMLVNHAPALAERLLYRALDMPTNTDRQLQVAHQATVTGLEAVGILKKAPTIQIDNRRIDIKALELWQQGGAQAWRNRVRGAKAPAIPERVANDEKAPPEAPHTT